MTRDKFLATHRLLVTSLAAAFAAAFSWACWAELDIVAIAEGRVQPVTTVRVSQPVEGGVVREVLVQDGQRVQAGTPLVLLDPLPAEQDATASRTQQARLQIQLQRIDAELGRQSFSPAPAAALPGSAGAAATADVALREAALREYALRRQALAAATAEARAAYEKASSDALAAQERLVQAQRRLPLVTKQLEMQQALRAQGFVSEKEVNDRLKDHVDAQQELAAQLKAVQSARSGATQAEAAMARVEGDYRKQLASERAQAAAELAAADAEAAKRGHRLSQTTLVAPIAGTVNGVGVLSPGQVVAAGASLLSVVPLGTPLRFEGWLKNEDAPYVLSEMPTRVKVAAYPFQKYGWLEGSVSWRAVDAETPEALRNVQGEHLLYKVRVSLASQSLVRDGKRVELQPGMQATADVVIGKRTLMEYLLNPARKVLSEAARER